MPDDTDSRPIVRFADSISKVLGPMAAWTPDLIEGVTTRDVTKTSKGISGIALGFLNLAIELNRKEGRKVDLDKVGLGSPMDIAAKCSMKGNILRSRFLELLRNSIDPDFPHDIRDSDIDLADSLAPVDFLNMMALHSYAAELGHAYAAFKKQVEKKAQNHGLGGTMVNSLSYIVTDCHQIIKQSNAVFGSGILMPIEELRYSFSFRGNCFGGSGDLFNISLLQLPDSDKITFTGTNENRPHSPFTIPVSDFSDLP